MSTHCGIAVKDGAGYNTIYCHHDGYPEYMYEMLTKNYNSEELATKLVSLGDASYIAENLEHTGPHSFDNPDYSVCCFYHRDRGEPWEDVAPSCFDLRTVCSNFYYSYVWEDGKWNFYKGGELIY